MPAGARLMVMRVVGNLNPVLVMAARTRSLDSFTARHPEVLQYQIPAAPMQCSTPPPQDSLLSPKVPWISDAKPRIFPPSAVGIFIILPAVLLCKKLVRTSHMRQEIFPFLFSFYRIHCEISNNYFMQHHMAFQHFSVFHCDFLQSFINILQKIYILPVLWYNEGAASEDIVTHTLTAGERINIHAKRFKEELLWLES